MPSEKVRSRIMPIQKQGFAEPCFNMHGLGYALRTYILEIWELIDTILKRAIALMK